MSASRIKVTVQGKGERSSFNTPAKRQRAIEDGKALARRLGAGWSVEVWENLGWHALARSPCGRVHVHALPPLPGRDPWFTAFLNRAGASGGRWAEGARTPRAAVRRVVAVARRDVAERAALVEGL